MFFKKIGQILSQLQVHNIATRYRIDFHVLTIVTLFCLFLHSNAPAERVITDEMYTNYQEQLQEVFYKYAQKPKKMGKEVIRLKNEFNINSPDWMAYTTELSQNNKKRRAINKEVKNRLKEKGIGYGTPRP